MAKGVLHREFVEEGTKLILEYLGYTLVGCSNGLTWEMPKDSNNVESILRVHGKLWTESNNYYGLDLSLDLLVPVLGGISELDYGDYPEKDEVLSSLESLRAEVVFANIVKFLRHFNAEEVMRGRRKQ